MKKYICTYCMLNLFVVVMMKGQADTSIGINRTTVSSTLDVGGGVNVSGNIYLGGDDSNLGDVGVESRVVTSRGKGLSPVWSNFGLTLPKHGNYFLQRTIIKNDTQNGIYIPASNQVGNVPYELDGSPYYIEKTSNWREFTDLRINLIPTTNPQRIVFQFEVTVSTDLDANESAWSSFAVGLAIDDPSVSGRKILKAVRSSIVRGIKYPQTLFYITFIIDDMEITSNNNILYVVAGYRNNSNNIAGANMYIGTNITGTTENQNLFKKASMRIDVYEKFR